MLDPRRADVRRTAFRRLRADHGVRSLLCEGGPTVFGALLTEGLVDELFLTLAPKLVGGGDEPAITAGPELDTPARARDPLGARTPRIAVPPLRNCR